MRPLILNSSAHRHPYQRSSRVLPKLAVVQLVAAVLLNRRHWSDRTPLANGLVNGIMIVRASL